jgi:hypothetical protein
LKSVCRTRTWVVPNYRATPLDSSQIELRGSEIESIDWAGGTLRIRFARAMVQKSMTGSRERTRWWQAGELVLEGVESPPVLPLGPQICAGGDLDANVFTYRDLIPIPFANRGHIRCLLRLQGQAEPLIVEALAARLALDGVPKYIEHIRP